MILAMTAGTFACGDDDDDDSAASGSEDVPVTTQPAATTAAPPGTTAEPTTEVPTTTEPESAGPGSAESTTAQIDPCEPVGTLVPGEHDLNDRCVEPEEGWAQAFIDSGAAWGTPCPAEPDETPQFILAVPNELIVVVDPDLNLSEQVNEVIGVLAGNDPDGPIISAEPGDVLIHSDEFPAQAQVVQITDKPDVDDVLALLDRFQGAGRSVDLNYLQPVQPNNGFRPIDDPEPTADSCRRRDALAEALKVAVIDSTNDQSVFDIDGNRMIDEDHGHGEFVTSIIASYGVSVTLYPVGPSSSNPSVRPSATGAGPGRWAPMMFEDKDIIGALAQVDPETDVVNLSLGGVGSASSGFDWGIGERLALAHAMSNMRLRKDSLQFVAAAGNNGGDVLHFPAAWRNGQAMSDIAAAISGTDPAAAADVETMSQILSAAMYAVGSVETEDNGGQRSDFSNCGDWVNGAAYGRKQVGVYPSSQAPTTDPDTGFPESGPGNAMWSGTSFAAANFTAALATGLVDKTDPTVFDPSTGARVTDPGTGLAC